MINFNGLLLAIAIATTTDYFVCAPSTTVRSVLIVKLMQQIVRQRQAYGKVTEKS